MPDGPALQAPALDDPPEPSSPSSADSDERPPLAARGRGDDDDEGDDHPAHDDHDDGGDGDDDDDAERRAWSEQRLARKRKDTLNLLFGRLDFLVYIELAALYYLDTSTLLFLFRLVTHVVPLQSTLSLLAAMRTNHSHTSIGLVLVANTLAILVHLFGALPAAGEATRHDLHGHLFVDLVGQRAPLGWPGRARLVCMDLTVLLLQGAAVGCLTELERRGWAKKGRAVEIDVGAAVARASSGVLPLTADDDGDGGRGVELRPMPPRAGAVASAAAAAAAAAATAATAAAAAPRRDPTQPNTRLAPGEDEAEAAERDRLLSSAEDEDVEGAYGGEGAASDGQASSATHELDRIYSGQVTILEVNFWHMIQTDYWERMNRSLAGRV